MILSVTNRLLCKKDFQKRLEQIASAKPCGIILREKDLSAQEYEKLAKQCMEICKNYEVPFIINSFVEVAERLEVGRIQLSMADFLKQHNALEKFSCVGVSIHSQSEAKQAEHLGADYLIAGHIYDTDCKKDLPPRGLSFLKEVCSAVAIPIFAIGGIQESCILDVQKSGARGVCVMSQLMLCDNPEEKVMVYHKCFS